MQKWKQPLQRVGLMILSEKTGHDIPAHHLFSRTFFLGVSTWALCTGIVLVRVGNHPLVPEPFTVLLAVLSFFIGWCWVILPLLVHLERHRDRWVHAVIPIGRFIRFATGAELWQKAAQGKLAGQFFGALLLEGVLGWILLHWPLAQPWQVLLVLAWGSNGLFFSLLPLLIFLGKWTHALLSRGSVFERRS